MDNKNKFNTVKIATCNDAHKAEAVNQLFERSLLFNRSDDICGIVISKNDEKQFIPISAIPDNVNIEKRDGIVTLVENPVVDSITTKADHNGIDWKSQHKIAETSAERTIILLCTKNIEDATNTGVIGGEILEVGEGIYGHYKISLTPAGSGLLLGATTFEQKAALVRAKYNGTYYYGIKFKSTVPANIYFSGWDHFPDGADAPLYTSYNDADLSEIIELGGGDSGGMTEAEKAEISAMNTQINTNKSDISALKTSVAGKADTGHTHTKSQITDFPTSLKNPNALTVNGKTYNGSSAVDAGVQTVANGGTGATNAADGFNTLADGVRDSSKPTDNEKMLLKSTGTWYKTTCLDFWNYIKDKISSVLGLTKDNYGGTAATILDYYDKGTPIRVRWAGPGINSAEWYPAFSADGSALEPINRTNIHAGKADTDANGNNIVNTYATKTELEKTTTKSVSLSAVTTFTTKYVKLGTFRWNNSFSFKCRITGNSFEDNVNINILGGTGTASYVCGYYSTNSSLTKSIIVKRGDAWNSDFEIYLKIVQLTIVYVYVTIDKDVQDRINISESTTAPSGTLEEIVFNNINGMFSGSVNAKNLVLYGDNGISSGYGSEPLTIGYPSGTGDGQSLSFDRNSIQAKANGTANVLYLNYYGGMVAVNAQNSSDGGLKVNNKMVIPIGAPSSLEDGCIWIS